MNSQFSHCIFRWLFTFFQSLEVVVTQFRTVYPFWNLMNCFSKNFPSMNWKIHLNCCYKFFLNHLWTFYFYCQYWGIYLSLVLLYNGYERTDLYTFCGCHWTKWTSQNSFDIWCRPLKFNGIYRAQIWRQLMFVDSLTSRKTTGDCWQFLKDNLRQIDGNFDLRLIFEYRFFRQMYKSNF